MVNSFAVAIVYHDKTKLVHELALFSARSADEAEGLAMHEAVMAGRELVSMLTFPPTISFGPEMRDMTPGYVESFSFDSVSQAKA